MKTVIIKNKGVSQATKITIGAVLLIGAGVGGYLWYIHSKKTDEVKLIDNQKDTAKPDQSLPSAVQNVNLPSSNTGASTNSNSYNPSSNSPSSLPKSITDFQDWMDSNHPNWLDDGTSLNKSLLKGYGTGGKQTKKAYAKYGSVYEAVKSLKIQDLTAYLKSGKDAIGKSVYSKYAGADIFDGAVADNVFNKIGKLPKAQQLGKVAKVIPSTTGFWIIFKTATNKFYKIYASNLNIFA